MTLPGFNAYLPAWANQNRAFRQIISTVTWYCTIVTPSPNKVTVCHSLQLVPQQRNTHNMLPEKMCYSIYSSLERRLLFSLWTKSYYRRLRSQAQNLCTNIQTAFFCSRDQLDINLETLLLIREELNGKHSQQQQRSILACISPTAYRVNMIYYYDGICCFIRLAGTHFSGMNGVRGWKETTI